jgi:hypothetical protein
MGNFNPYYINKQTKEIKQYIKDYKSELKNVKFNEYSYGSSREIELYVSKNLMKIGRIVCDFRFAEPIQEFSLNLFIFMENENYGKFYSRELTASIWHIICNNFNFKFNDFFEFHSGLEKNLLVYTLKYDFELEKKRLIKTHDNIFEKTKTMIKQNIYGCCLNKNYINDYDTICRIAIQTYRIEVFIEYYLLKNLCLKNIDSLFDNLSVEGLFINKFKKIKFNDITIKFTR